MLIQVTVQHIVSRTRDTDTASPRPISHLVGSAKCTRQGFLMETNYKIKSELGVKSVPIAVISKHEISVLLPHYSYQQSPGNTNLAICLGNRTSLFVQAIEHHYLPG